jgi:hypothetical protein
MFVNNGSNYKGIALVHSKEDYEDFIVDLYVSGGPFSTLDDWYNFFCRKESLSSCARGEDDIMQEDILTLISSVDEDKIPESYPALIIFDLEDFEVNSVGYGSLASLYDDCYTIVPIRDLDIRSIETMDKTFAIANFS